MSDDLTDVVTRLRHHEPIVRNNAVYAAATEIERLRAENATLVDRLDQGAKRAQFLAGFLNDA